MSHFPMLFMVIWALACILMASFSKKAETIVWPSITSAKAHNKLAGWSLAISFAICCALGFRFSLAEHFDTLAFLDVLGKLANFAGFAVATYFILTPSRFRVFITEFLPAVVGWSALGGPLGIAVGGGLGILMSFPSARDVGGLGITAIFYAGPIVGVVEWSTKHKTEVEKLRWFAATLVLLGALLQLGVSIERFSSS